MAQAHDTDDTVRVAKRCGISTGRAMDAAKSKIRCLQLVERLAAGQG